MASKNTKKQQAQATKNTASIAKATSIDLSKTLNSLTSAGVQIQGSLSKMGEELIQKHADLQAVDEAIALKKQEMESLHGVDSVLLTIDEAKAQHAQFLEDKAKEKEQLAQENLAFLAQRAQDRAREEEEYKYNLQQGRKANQDAWTEEVRIRGNQERDRREAFEKDIANREAFLKSKETEYQAASARIANWDADVKKEVDKAVAIATNSLNKDLTHKAQLVEVQNKAIVDGLNAALAQKTQLLTDRDATIAALTAQLKDAYAKNAELASKAVEGAANAKSMADMQSLITNVGGNGTRPRS